LALPNILRLSLKRADYTRLDDVWQGRMIEMEVWKKSWVCASGPVLFRNSVNVSM